MYGLRALDHCPLFGGCPVRFLPKGVRRMALLTVNTATSAGITPSAPTQISAWSGTPDTIAASDIGERGVVAEIVNTSGGSLDFRVSDSLTTPAGNAAANGYTTVTVATGGQGARVVITLKNVNLSTGLASVGASTTNAAFTVRLVRY
jgi:hypothetical protein